MFIVASDLSETQRERLTSSPSLQGMNVTVYNIDAVKSVKGIVLHAEKFNGESFTPSEQTRRQHEQNFHRRKIMMKTNLGNEPQTK